MLLQRLVLPRFATPSSSSSRHRRHPYPTSLMKYTGLLLNGVLAVVSVILLFHGYIFFCTSAALWPPPSAPHNLTLQDKKIALLATVVKLYTVTVYDQLDAWCEQLKHRHNNLDIYILYKQGHHQENTYFHTCEHIHLLLEPDDLPDNRIDRLAVLRNFLRNAVVDPTTYDAVVVMDLDADQLPTSSQLVHGLATLDKGHDVVCANGYEVLAGMKQPYDLYAMIEESGHFRYGEEGLTVAWYALLQQPRLYRKIEKAKLYPVQSCFGGLAIYKASVYFDARCNYKEQPAGTDLEPFLYANRVCEHVVFHECLRHYHTELRAGILSTLPLERTCEMACQVIGLIYLVSVYGGCFVTVVVVFRWKRWLQSTSVHPRKTF